MPPAPLVPENDSTTLFTGSGMQPMIPYLLGQTHPEGNRLTDSQLSFRAQDIEEVGDNRHTTFFEMLGNWSLGDYFKDEQIPWVWEFLTEIVGLDPQKIYVSVFAGDEKYNLPRDNKSVEIWKKLFFEKGIEASAVELGTESHAADVGMQGGRIFYYGEKKNLWSRFGGFEEIPEGEPFGPDSEMFYEFSEIEHDPKYGKYCHPNCDCGHFLEIGNSVFMEFKKLAENKFEPLPKKNVDFGGGLERITAASQNLSDIFEIDLFTPLIFHLEKISGKSYEDKNFQPDFRIITDHLRGAVFLIASGVTPSNKTQGYTLRRLIRRAVLKGHQLNIKNNLTKEIARQIVKLYQDVYPWVKNTEETILSELSREEDKFRITLERGLKEFNKQLPNMKQNIEDAGKIAFDLYQTYGFPYELTHELLAEQNLYIDSEGFMKAFTQHRELSRTASAGMFRGGLQDHSEITTKYHTATHLLHTALRQILGTHVQQKGSNITAERIRFDFSQPEKLTEEQLKQVEDLVNQKISEDLPVTREETSKEKALKSGALGFFAEKYGDKVSVYTIGNFSKEICGGPHIEHTGQLGHFQITKEESAGAGVRRIYATLSYPSVS